MSEQKECPLTASECLHHGAVEHIHTISILLIRATLALRLLFHESITLMLCLLLYYNNHHNGQMAIDYGGDGQRTGKSGLIWSGLLCYDVTITFTVRSLVVSIIISQIGKSLG